MAAERSVKSARRALEILDLYEKLRRPAAVGEIAAMLGYPQSSTSFLMNDLRRTGYLNYDTETRRFAPTMRVALLGGWIHAGTFGRNEIFGLLARVRELTRMTTMLCTQNGVELQYMYVIEARRSSSKLALRPGTSRPICRGAGGLVLLAERTDAEVGRIVRLINATAAAQHEDLGCVLRHVGRTRRDGYGWITNGVFRDVGSVAVRLPFNDILNKPLVLSVAGSARRIRAEHRLLADVLRKQVASHCQTMPDA
ncbi:helix-turn-helix domain-containing protein [Vineibacter terrae]|uniref:Helix-turn-helix domain-containing protein n=1 Tax=Vineibacter terrae TaxID=2586908 RepID=A0A5C8PPL1_9HYPH|nr:helix-turn-helix domain-containing protein [Vineibacter terrae]